MAKLTAPNGVTGCSFDGTEYKVKKGVVDVPDEAVAALFPHGFRQAGVTEDEVDARIEAQEAVDAAQALVNAAAESSEPEEEAAAAVLAQAQEALAALDK
ncbi:MAG: hypothetical protein ABFC42_12905 [Sulfuricella sp.]